MLDTSHIPAFIASSSPVTSPPNETATIAAFIDTISLSGTHSLTSRPMVRSESSSRSVVEPTRQRDGERRARVDVNAAQAPYRGHSEWQAAHGVASPQMRASTNVGRHTRHTRHSSKHRCVQCNSMHKKNGVYVHYEREYSMLQHSSNCSISN